MSKEKDIIKWWESYSEEEAKRRKEEWLSDHNKSRLSNTVLDKLTDKEFNTALANTLKDIDYHMTDSYMHITKAERDTWNKVTYEALTKNATTESNGLMSSEDKAKLNSIQEGANNYTHPKYTPVNTFKYKKVDEYGHIYGYSNPDILPVTVDSVDTLNGKPLEWFAKNNNQVFNNITVPNVDNLETAKDNTAINYTTMKNHILDSVVQFASDSNNLNTKKIWFNTSNNTTYYYNNAKWNRLTIPDKPVTFNDDTGLIDTSLLPVTGFPIGYIATIYGNTVPDNFLLLDGSVINKSDYPALWDRVSKYCKIIQEYEYNANNSTMYFSYVNNDNTKIRLPNFTNMYLRPTSDVNKHGNLGGATRADICGTFPITPFKTYDADTDIKLYNKFPVVKYTAKTAPNYTYRSIDANEDGIGYTYANTNKESLGFYYRPIVKDSSDGFSPRSVTVLYCIRAK